MNNLHYFTTVQSIWGTNSCWYVTDLWCIYIISGQVSCTALYLLVDMKFQIMHCPSLLILQMAATLLLECSGEEEIRLSPLCCGYLSWLVQIHYETWIFKDDFITYTHINSVNSLAHEFIQITICSWGACSASVPNHGISWESCLLSKPSQHKVTLWHNMWCSA